GERPARDLEDGRDLLRAWGAVVVGMALAREVVVTHLQRQLLAGRDAVGRRHQEARPRRPGLPEVGGDAQVQHDLAGGDERGWVDAGDVVGPGA
ncbi:hypothetical protein DF186_14950, partial [Enterococcus hirae]